MKRVLPGADYDVQLTLELARVAREPTLADKQRVLEALQVRLGDMPSLSSAGESTTGVRLVVPKVTRPTLGAHAAHLARSLVSSKAAMHLLWVGAATGALGFWAGVHLTEPEPVEAPRAVASVTRGPSEPPAAREPPALIEAPQRQPEPSPREPMLPGTTVLRPAAVAPLAPETPRLELMPPAEVRPPAPAPLAQPVKPIPVPLPGPAPVARRAHDAARGSEAAGASAAPLDDNARFFEAVRLLQRAQRALDGGELALALVLLEELDTRFPPELLGEEREAARVIALCKGGDTERASRLARELATRSPSSIYAARITRSCGSFDTASSARP
jgi:hypothetical protein